MVSARDAVKLPTMHRTLLSAPQQRVIWSKLSAVVEKTCSIPSLVLDVGILLSYVCLNARSCFSGEKVVAFLMCIMLITSAVKHLFLYLLVISCFLNFLFMSVVCF